jgi:hypothetical protein
MTKTDVSKKGVSNKTALSHLENASYLNSETEIFVALRELYANFGRATNLKEPSDLSE